MAETPFVSFRGVFAGYGGADVLKDVNCDVLQGGMTTIVGPNGSGKSTLLKTVSGLLKPRVGEIIFKGVNLVGMTPKEILKLGVVQVPQNHSLFREMTVEQNVELGAFLVKDKKVIAQRLNTIREMFPIVTERAQDKAGSLSGGQQRLVARVQARQKFPQGHAAAAAKRGEAREAARPPGGAPGFCRRLSGCTATAVGQCGGYRETRDKKGWGRRKCRTPVRTQWPAMSSISPGARVLVVLVLCVG